MLPDACIYAFRVALDDLPRMTAAINRGPLNDAWRPRVVDIWKLEEDEAVVLVKMRRYMGVADWEWRKFIKREAQS